MTAELRAALLGGATLVTANARLARSLEQQFDAAQLADGRAAWPSPSILTWSAFVASLAASAPGSMADPPVLTAAQEQAIWESIIDASAQAPSLLQPHAAARLAGEAWRLVNEWRIPFPGRRRLPEWEATAETTAFLGWAQQFQFHVRWLNRVDSTRPLEALIARGAAELRGPGELWLAGFDELSPAQRDLVRVLELGGTSVTHFVPNPPGPSSPPDVRLAAFPDARAEAGAAAAWAAALLAHLPPSGGSASIGIVVPDLEQRRGALDRAFRLAAPGAFHFSLGPPLSDRPLVAAALRLLSAAADERMPWATASSLLFSPFVAGFGPERGARAALDIELRRWRATELALPAIARHQACPPRLARILWNAETLRRAWPAEQKPSEWSLAFGALLEAFGWPGDDPLGSVEYQIVDAWRAVLSELASLDLAAPSISRGRALSLVRRLAAARRFEVESRGEPIQILGMLEAAGSRFDHLWVMGLSDEVWPARPSPNPFIPLSLQRKHNVPHSSPARELAFSTRVTRRLLQSGAGSVIASYARADTEREMEPSPLVASLPRWEMPDTPIPSPEPAAAAAVSFEEFSDASAPPLGAGVSQSGGTRALELQAKCPFRAFAELRAGARELEDPEPGLDPRERGGFIHAALELFWKRYPSSEALQSLSEAALREAVAAAVEEAVSRRRTGSDALAARILTLERRRLEELVAGWLVYEKRREEPFTVIEPEQERTVEIGGLTVQVRLDRLDRLADGSHVLIDYKSKAPRLAGWEGDRPESPQLPIYAVTAAEPLAAVAFAQVRTGDCRFVGYASPPASLPNARDEDPGDLAARIGAWRTVLSQLGEQFRAGRAEVDPKERYATCDYCHLPAFCRVEEKKRDR